MLDQRERLAVDEGLKEGPQHGVRHLSEDFFPSFLEKEQTRLEKVHVRVLLTQRSGVSHVLVKRRDETLVGRPKPLVEKGNGLAGEDQRVFVAARSKLGPAGEKDKSMRIKLAGLRGEGASVTQGELPSPPGADSIVLAQMLKPAPSDISRPGKVAQGGPFREREDLSALRQKAAIGQGDRLEP
jgi:hypothetical protein